MRKSHAIYGVLARAGLGLPAAAAQGAMSVGREPLHAHQVEAVLRLTPLLREFHGALLADTVGLGKTHVALAIGMAYRTVQVIAPAALVHMWRATIVRTSLQPRPAVLSLHTFSRERAVPRRAPSGSQRLVIIDEAHHLRNPSTQRYAHVAEWCRGAHVLLLTATPVHNRPQDLQHMLALFLGARAESLSHGQTQRLIVRRNSEELSRPGISSGVSVAGASVAHTHAAHPPPLVAHAPFAIGDAPAVTRALATLPPPLPTREGRAAGALIALGLVRAWCSSAAACVSMIRKRRARAVALAQILAEQRLPTSQELRAWTISEDTVQLGFTELLLDDSSTVASSASWSEARAQLDAHAAALTELEHVVSQIASTLDRVRVESLRKVRASHRGVAVVAFSQYAETVRGLGRLMRWDQGVATLTSLGGAVAGGKMSREELLARVAPRAYGAPMPRAHERVLLLLTTDLLAEGVNLQDAGVVVHLDMPWTPAAIAQREGRIARLGSLHNAVHAYSMAPPGGGAELMRLAERLRVKARAAAVVISPERVPPVPRTLVAVPTLSSPLTRVLRSWLWLACEGGDAGITRHVVRHAKAAWLAVVPNWEELPESPTSLEILVGGTFTNGVRRTRATRDHKQLLRIVLHADRAREGSTVDVPVETMVERTAKTSTTGGAELAFETASIRMAEAAVYRALRQYSRKQQAQQLVPHVAFPVRRAQLVIRALLARASISHRLLLASRAALALRALQRLRGAGDERAVAHLMESVTADHNMQASLDWLDAVIALAPQSVPSTSHTAPHTPEPTLPVSALLLLLPDFSGDG